MRNSCMAVIRFFTALATSMTLMAGAAPAFDSSVLDSVVAVIPAWPGAPSAGTGTRDAPEGTAVAVMAGGYLVTNAHVLGRAQAADVRLADGRLVAVEIVAREPRTDLALLKAPMDFPILRAAPPPPLGARVCAVGNQFGLGLSVTCGVVSARGRTNAGFNPVEDFVQTDAPVNPGGSGGALVDDEGRMVGLVSAIFTKNSDADIGVNFAASMALVRRVVDDLKTFGRFRPARAGLLTRPLSRDERRRWSGARIARIIAGGAADKAGLKINDIVTQVGERPIRHASDVRAAFFLRRPGDRVDVRYQRDGAPGSVSLEMTAGR